MSLKKYISRLSLLAALAMLLALPDTSHAAHSSADIPKLALSAQATLRKQSDELQMKVGVVTFSPTAEVALNENSTKMQAVIVSLEEAGLTKDDYETGQFSIHPTYTPYPVNPPYDWKPSINGYEVTNSLSIHTDRLDLVGKLIDVSNKAGANSISDIHFGLGNPRQYWTEALGAAAAHAIADAEAIAAATGVRLVRVLSISLDNTNVISHNISVSYVAKAMGGEVAAPIEPGDVSIMAQISIVYEIGSE